MYKGFYWKSAIIEMLIFRPRISILKRHCILILNSVLYFLAIAVSHDKVWDQKAALNQNNGAKLQFGNENFANQNVQAQNLNDLQVQDQQQAINQEQINANVGSAILFFFPTLKFV